MRLEIPLDKCLYSEPIDTKHPAIKALIQSIKEMGVFYAICVVQCGKDFIIADGNYRAYCAHKAGLKTIPASIGPDYDGGYKKIWEHLKTHPQFKGTEARVGDI